MNPRVGIRDVARAAGVSVTLASWAINGKPGVSAASRARILQVAEELGYRADPAARALRLGHSDSYALMIRNLRNPFFLDVISALQEAALVRDASILVLDTAYSAEREYDYVGRMAAQRIAGLAIAPVGPGESVARWHELRPDQPIVVLNAVRPEVPGASRVAPDNVHAVRLATEHLVDLGHRRIVFFTAPRSVMADNDRLDTYLTVCGEAGIDPWPVETALSLEGIGAVTGTLLDGPDPPTAIITNSDFTVHAVYAAAREAGVRIGTDLSVVGHDDLSTSPLLDPPLTTVALDRRSVGRAIFDRLIGTESGDHLEPVELVVRSSTGPPPTPRAR